MFNKLTQNFADMATIKTLCEAAERIARDNHQERPGAEHFVLSALELPMDRRPGYSARLA